MNIVLKVITIQAIVLWSTYKKVCQGYKDSGENGVYGMGGQLNIRPSYQREFVYKDVQRNAVMDTVRSSFPLNVLYFAVNKDGSLEVIDGQQRLISIGQYINGDYSINDIYFCNLTEDQQEQILNYELMVFFCEGTDSEKLEWFRKINIAGEKLMEQELRNAVYAGPWVSDAKRYFSKTGCPAYQIASEYLKGVAIRQDYLETIIEWINNGKIEDYMAKHQFDDNAVELWEYFLSVINWVKKLFPKYRREMKGLPWGEFFNEYGKNEYNPEELEEKVSALMLDEDVQKKPGIYAYIFTGDERKLNIRSFSLSQKREVYEKQNGICPHCKEHFEIDEMEADHITPWSKGGKTVLENCQMLCLTCNRTKSDK
jgi:hypothetical protein